MSVGAIVLATGHGADLGSATSAAFVRVGGTPLVIRAVDMLLGSDLVDHVTVAVAAANMASIRGLFADRSDRVVVLQFDGAADFWMFPAQVHTMVVHDVLRPLAPSTLVAPVVSTAVARNSVVVPVLPVSDTIKEVDERGAVVGTVDRAALRVVQSPVAVPADLLRQGKRLSFTNVTELIGQLGRPTLTVPGDPLAFEVRTPWDLEFAEMLVS